MRQFRKLGFASLLASRLLSLLAFAPASGAMAAQWELTFADEFDGPAETFPDAKKWQIAVTQQPYNREAQAYEKRTRNVRLDGQGHLELVAYEETSGPQAYTSGKVTTEGLFAQTYGRWEARMKLPAGTGLWPAFWMLGVENGCGGWPACGEIDIMENRGRLPKVASSALHGPGYSGNTPLVHGYQVTGAIPDFTADFHVFACEWDAESIRFIVDSTTHYTVLKTQVEKYGAWVYNHDFYLILNLAIGGEYDGMQLPPTSALPAKVVVDYVRVYKANTAASLQKPKSRWKLRREKSRQEAAHLPLGLKSVLGRQ
jgi:beta-glucanase (GH16 family)